MRRSIRSPRASRSTTTTSAPRSPIPTAGSRISTPRPCSSGSTARERGVAAAARGAAAAAVVQATPGASCGTTSATTCRVKRGAHYFYLHNDGSAEPERAVWSPTALEAPGRVLFDPNAARADATVALSEFTRRCAATSSPTRSPMAAPTGRSGASGASTDGQRPAGRRCASPSSGASPGRATAQASTTAATRRSPGGRGDDSGRPARLLSPARHRPGCTIASSTRSPTTRRASRRARVTEDGHYLVITLVEGYEKNGVELLDLRNPGAQAQPLFAGWDALYNFIGSRGDELYFQTTRRRAAWPRDRRRRARAGDAARIVVHEGAERARGGDLRRRPHRRQVRRGRARGRAHLRARRAAWWAACRCRDSGGIDGFHGEGRRSETFFSYTDYLTPRRIYRLDVSADCSDACGASRTCRPPTADFVTEQVFYTSKDGTRVPMYITHRRDLAKNGDHAGAALRLRRLRHLATPSYRPQVQAWLEMGGAYAEANLRGGGEYGEAWHKAGTLANKQHVFDDFIAAAEYLIREHYTRSARLGIHGRSNGGLLVGAVLTQRPELFGGGAPGGRRARHAALSHRERQRAAVVIRLRPRRGSGAVQDARMRTPRCRT